VRLITGSRGRAQAGGRKRERRATAPRPRSHDEGLHCFSWRAECTGGGGNPLACKGGAPSVRLTEASAYGTAHLWLKCPEPDSQFSRLNQIGSSQGSETGHVGNRRWIGPAVHAVAPHRNPVQPVELNVWSGTFSAELPGPLARCCGQTQRRAPSLARERSPLCRSALASLKSNGNPGRASSDGEWTPSARV